jgi:hypothetical protein
LCWGTLVSGMDHGVPHKRTSPRACDTGRVSDPAGPNADYADRLAFAVPPIDSAPDWIEPEFLDPEDSDDRAALIRAAHPEFDAAIREGAETVIVAGQEMNPRLHFTIHELVANQLIEADPPEVWDTARRLRLLGYDRHEILHMLGGAMSGELWQGLTGRRSYDREAHVAALEALPDSWERARPGGPAVPASRASHADQAKRRRRAARAARRRNRRR